MTNARTTFKQRLASVFMAGFITVCGTIAQDGFLDVTFSGDGQYGFMPELPDVSTVDILEVDGAIFPVLSAMNGGTTSYILKLNSDGSMDSGFDADGVLEFPGVFIDDAALAGDGSSILILSGVGLEYRMCVIDLGGSIVRPWTTVFTSPDGVGFTKMLVDHQGRVCIGKGAYIDGLGYGQVIRLNEDLTTDDTFGTGGVAYTPAAPFSYPLMEIDGLGRILLGSYGLGSAGIWRFDTDGTMDPSFNYALDLSPYSLEPWILDFAVAPDHSIYVQPNTWGWPPYLFKLLPNGSLDTSFGTSGHLILNDPSEQYSVAPDELLVEPNGGLIVLAQAYGPDGYMSAKFLTRLDELGVVDQDFNPGIQPIDDHGYGLRINFHCATLQHDGKVLSMDQVVKWQDGELFGYAPLITRFNNEKGSVVAHVNDAGSRGDVVFVFPNPTAGRVTLRLPDEVAWQDATVTITDNRGALVAQERLGNGVLDLSALSAGAYSCLVGSGEGSRHALIIKQ